MANIYSFVSKNVRRQSFPRIYLNSTSPVSSALTHNFAWREANIDPPCSLPTFLLPLFELPINKIDHFPCVTQIFTINCCLVEYLGYVRAKRFYIFSFTLSSFARGVEGVEENINYMNCLSTHLGLKARWGSVSSYILLGLLGLPHSMETLQRWWNRDALRIYDKFQN